MNLYTLPVIREIDSFLLKQPKKIHLCWLFEKLGLPVPRYFVGWTDTGGGDHGGSAWTISVNTEVAGIHTNVGAFTVNNGITVTVKVWDGANYGSFEVQATSINVIGTINADKAGFGGGGAGGGGGGARDGSYPYPGAGGIGGAGVAGGVNGSNGIIGGTGSGIGGNGGNGGAGGGTHGGAGSSGTAGGTENGGDPDDAGQGVLGGYAGAGVNGDSSVDESLLKGSGGGGGGGGGGLGKNPTLNWGGGGGGGGAGNYGGGYVKLISSGSLILTGIIYARGGDNSYGNGENGQQAYAYHGGDGGDGGVASASGLSNGGTGGLAEFGTYRAGDGGEGGYGAGGGVLLKCGNTEGAMNLDGTIDNRGGGSSTINGGTIKLFYAEGSDITYTHYQGRHYPSQQANTVPNAPTNCVSSYVATDYAKCTWTDNSNIEDGFRIEYQINGGAWTFWKNVSANVTDSGNLNVGANKQVRFNVRSYNGSSYSGYSYSGYVYTIPTAPSGVGIVWATLNETITVSWTDNSAYEQDFEIAKDKDGGWTYGTYDVASPYSDTAPTGLDHRYRHAVRARCPDGRLSAWAYSGYIYSTPPAPTNCGIALGTIDVTWTDNSSYEEGFEVDRQLDGGGWNLVHTTAAEAESWGDSSQPTGDNVKYEYRVRAKIGTLYSGYSTSNASFIKTCSESIALSDAYSRVWSIYRTFTESINLSDSYSRVCNWFRTFTETLTLTDSVKKQVSKIFSEAIALSDVLVKKVAKIFTESITLTDIYSRVWSIYRTFTETLGLADTLIKKPVKTFIETLHLTDTYTRVVTWYRTFTETLTLADSLRKTISKTFLESLTLADTLIKKVTYDRANKLQALESDKMFPSNIVRNIQHGLDVAKASSPVKGDWYIAINTQKVYVCFLDDAWTQIYP